MHNLPRTSILLTAAALGAAALWAQPTPPPGGGAPPGGGGSSAAPTYYATYKLDGGSATASNETYQATADDTSAVWVTNSGTLALTNPTIKTSGNTSSQDNSSFYGLNAGLLATAAGKITVTGGTITTTGTGANGAFSTGSGSTVTLSKMTIKASADGGHAVMATQAGAMTITDVDMNTSGGSSSAIATDRGGGTITVTGGKVITSGNNSAGIYSTGDITVNGTEFTSTGAEGAVIEGANSITLNNVKLTSTKEKWGVMIYQSMSGDASGNRGVFTMTGGSMNYTPTAGPLFYVNNTTAVITLKGVTLTAGSGVLLKAAAGSWGNSGSNGGTVNLTADAQTLNGNMIIDNISALMLTLKNASTLTGAINAEKTAKTADITLDGTSTWTVTADSYVSALTGAAVSDNKVTNIIGNGHNVYYDGSLSGNSYLQGKTYTIASGGSLMPLGSVTTNPPTIESVVNGASFVAGIAPSAWIAIKGTNLASSTGSVTTADLVKGYLPTTFGGATVTVNGKPAFLSYVSPTQINAQAPADATTGSVTVTVATSAGSTSAAVTMQPVMPGLFASGTYALAVRPSDSAIISGATGATARPGDILSFYATGLGATSPAVDAGLVFSGAYATTAVPDVTIGGTAAPVSYSGLVGVGLYQINLTVPTSLQNGIHPVIVTMGGVSSPSSTMLKVALN